MARVIRRETCPKCGAASELVTTLIYTSTGDAAELTGVEMHCLRCGYTREYHVGPPPDMGPRDR